MRREAIAVFNISYGARSGAAAALEAALDRARAALRSGDEEAAIPALAQAAENSPDPRGPQYLGLLHRAAGGPAAAVAAFERAAALAPNDARIALGLAYARLEAGLPATDAFSRAARAGSTDPALPLGHASALLAQAGGEAAAAFLRDRLAREPIWIPGHWLLSRILWAEGDRTGFTHSIEQAIARAPGQIPLWRQLLFTLMHARLYPEALVAIGRGRATINDGAFFDICEAACLSELGELAAADAVYARTKDDGTLPVAIQRIRHELRAGRPERAADLAEPHCPGPQGHMVYPYLAIAWKLLDDPRRDWLDCDEGLIRVYDLADRLPPLDGLADRLRSFHWAAGQPLEQSLRGGTQTDGALLSRVEPEIRALRGAFLDTVRDYVRRLPPPTSGHPLLGPRRDRPLRFAGSWSVRLRAGHHANHVHPDGWISSVFYAAVPQGADLGDAPAGWLQLGEPDDALGIPFGPFRRIEPKPGRLVLFPSTTWHGTVPFARGERLTVAFDVARPR